MLKAESLSFSFDEKEIIKDLSFHIREGERVALCGASGKGKTTLLRIIIGLQKGYKGSVTLKRGAKISMTFQDDVLLPWYTAKENIALVSSTDEAEKWLKLFCLEGSENLRPDKLSGGMRRRVAIARACSVRPDILILDEAFKGLDPKLKEHIMAVILREFADKTVIFTSHDSLEISRLATRAIEL